MCSYVYIVRSYCHMVSFDTMSCYTTLQSTTAYHFMPYQIRSYHIPHRIILCITPRRVIISRQCQSKQNQLSSRFATRGILARLRRDSAKVHQSLRDAASKSRTSASICIFLARSRGLSQNLAISIFPPICIFETIFKRVGLTGVRSDWRRSACCIASYR